MVFLLILGTRSHSSLKKKSLIPKAGKVEETSYFSFQPTINSSEDILPKVSQSILQSGNTGTLLDSPGNNNKKMGDDVHHLSLHVHRDP